MLGSRWLFVCLTLFAWMLPRLAESSTLLQLDFEELVRTSPTIVRAQVLENTVKTDDATGRTHLLTTFKVLETLRGETKERVTVRQLAGFGGNKSLKLPGNVEFSKGDEAVLFLFQRAEEGSVYFLRGMAQGRFKVIEDAATGVKSVQRPLKGVRLLKGFGTEKKAKKPSDIMPNTLDAFRREVEKVLQADENVTR